MMPISISVCGLTLCVFLLAGCAEGAPDQRAFSSMKVRVGPLVDSVMATGRVHTVSSVNVSSQLSGRVDEVYVDFNDEVTEGQPLARLDRQRFQSRVEELKAALAVAQAELQAVVAGLQGAHAKFEEDNKDYRRKLDLLNKGSVPESEVSRAQAIRLQSQSGLRAFEASKAIKNATINAAAASLNQAEIDLGRTVIRTPIAGIVIKRSIEAGQTVATSLSAPDLFTIAHDLKDIEIHAAVDEADIGKVVTGQPVLFRVDAYPGKRFDGQVSQIRKAPEIAANVVSYAVVISAQNPQELMFPGMTALVEIVTSRKENVLQVPTAALRFEMPISQRPNETNPVGARVWVVANGTYASRELEIGYSDSNFTEVLSGDLSADEEVLIGYRN
jgi:HlyD family secretion protein